MIWASSGREKHCYHDLSKNNSQKASGSLYKQIVTVISLHYYKCCLSQLTFLQHKPDNGFKRTQAQCASYETMA